MLSMAAYVYHTHEPYYSRPDEFLPERWIGDTAQDAESHLISFSRGSRNCLGLQLAYAELFYTFAYMFRRFEITLSENMNESDMEWHDAFLVAFFGHLKVRVKKTDS